jgi:hypothetical protein
MKRKYPAKLFYWGIFTNFMFRFFYLSVPGFLLSIVGIWIKRCLWCGLALLAFDLLLSAVEQLRIRKAALIPSDHPEFNELMEALTGPDGLEAFGKILEEKIQSAQSMKTAENENDENK